MELHLIKGYRNRFKFNSPLMARRHWVDTDNASMFAHTNKGVEADYLLDDYLFFSRRQSIKTEAMHRLNSLANLPVIFSQDK